MSAGSFARRAPPLWLVLTLQLLLIAVVLGAWQWAPASVLDDTLVSRPSLIARQTIQWLGQGVLEQQAFYTLSAVCVGLLAGALAGVAAGLLAATSPWVEDLIEPALRFLFALPKVALVPLFIVAFGVSWQQETWFVGLVVFFFFFYASFNGAQAVPASLVNTLRLAGATTAQRMRLLYLPASFGWLLVGLRLALPYAFVSGVSAEVVSSRNGLGNLVKSSASVMDPAGMFAALLTLVVVSLLFSAPTLYWAARTRWNLSRET